MKKLLVILLLLFPVHGAWGEIITLSCSYYQIFMTKSSSSHKIDPPMTKIFRFDFQKRTFGDFNRPLDLLTDQYIRWHFPKQSKSPGKYYIEYVSIDRYTGIARSELTIDFPEIELEKFMKNTNKRPPLTSSSNANCRKSLGMRKF